MGFCHLHAFNLSMLGKQAWKFITQPNVGFKSVQSQYFSKTDFLDVNLGHSPNHMWRSIFASGAVIREGHEWRIENGEKINVWGQPWLQSKGNTFVSSTVPHGLELMKVSSLIDHASLSWRLDIMSQILNTNDINHIQNIPLLNVDMEDEKIWKFIAHGLYTVKSSHGDPILRQQFQSRRAMESGWSLRVSPKIKHLSWRILRDYLPSRQNLIRKGVIYQPNCTFCENGLENE